MLGCGCSTPTKRCCGGHLRFVILAISILCLSLNTGNSLALNFTVICMAPPPAKEVENVSKSPNSENSSSSTTAEGAELYSPAELGWLFSATGIGLLIGTLPIAQLNAQIGLRNTMTLYGLISALSTMFLPFCVYNAGFIAVFVLRLLQGFAYAVLWVATGAITSAWSPLSNYGLFLAFLSCSKNIGPALIMPLAGVLCTSRIGWPAIYYILGVATLFAHLAFYALYRNRPSEQRHVSTKELELIEVGQATVVANDAIVAIPYAKICADRVVWGMFVSHIVASSAYHILLQYGPIYFNKSLKVQVSETGLAASLPLVLSIIVKLISGPVSDQMQCLSEKAKVILFTSIPQFLMAFCFLPLALLPKFGIINVPLMQICYTSAITIISLNTVGVYKGVQLFSRQFSHVIFAWSQILSSITLLLSPFGVSWLAPQNTINQWTLVFLITASCLTVGTIFFLFNAEVEPRSWTNVENVKNSEDNIEMNKYNNGRKNDEGTFVEKVNAM